MSRSRRRFSSFAALALVLLLAQVGALAHGYSHLAKADPVGIGNSASQTCLECLSFTPLLSAVGPPDAIVVFHPPCAGEVLSTVVEAFPGRRSASAFRSRAPPFPV